jgi:transposase
MDHFLHACRKDTRKNAAPESQHLRTIAALRDKLQRKNEVVAELMEEYLKLKKELGEL